MRRWLAAGLAALLLASGCSGGSDSSELQALREKVAALEATTTVAPATTPAGTRFTPEEVALIVPSSAGVLINDDDSEGDEIIAELEKKARESFNEENDHISEKWKVKKDGSKIIQQIEGNKTRVIDYLAYPFNYGFIPQTIMPVEEGGDGDPLDIIIIGSNVERGSVLKVKVIGAIIAMDNNEIDISNALKEGCDYIGIGPVFETTTKKNKKQC